MEKITVDKLIPKLIFGTYEEFCENIVVFLDKVSTLLLTCELLFTTFNISRILLCITLLFLLNIV